MFNWREVPFVRLLLPLMIGITMGLYFDLPLHFLNYVLVFLFLMIGWMAHRKLSLSEKSGFSLSVQFFLFLAGYQLIFYQSDYHRSSHFRHAVQISNTIVGTVTNVKVAKRHIKTILDVEQISSLGYPARNVSGRILLYVDHVTARRIPLYGNRLVVSTSIRPVEGPKNPEAFDYRRYLRMKGIHHQGYVADEDWTVAEYGVGHPVMMWTQKLRRRLLSVLDEHLPSDNEFAVGAAMLLGHRDRIGETITNAYAGTGAMHVMAVSGLHIGLVFLGLGMLLRLLPWRNRLMRIFKPVMLLLGIWLFALLTGAAPSAMRAAFMFSLIVIGQSLKRDGNIYNTLAASAFCLLCYDPFLLMEVGFQLSYLAVAGIVYFQPKIFRLWYIENRPGQYLWKLASVGLAAQLTTFPLSLLYFHQFPLYFWLSGLIVVPAAVVIIGLGALLFISHYLLPFTSFLFGKLLLWSIWSMNALIFLIRKLPAGLIEGIWISLGVFVLLYALIGCIIVAINSERLRWVVYGLGVGVALTGLTAFTDIQQQEQAAIVIYHQPRHTLIDFIGGHAAVQLTDPLLSQKRIRQISQNHRSSIGIRQVDELLVQEDPEWKNDWLWYRPPFLQMYNLKMGIVDELPPREPAQPVAVDYVLLVGNPRCSLAELQACFSFDTLLLDASNRHHLIDQWIIDCTAENIPVRCTRDEGALFLYPDKNTTPK